MLATVVATIAALLPPPCGATLSRGDSVADALAEAKDGDRLCLSAGSYDRVSTSAVKTQVTVAPAWGARATVAGIGLTRAAGITFEGLDITPEGVMVRGSTDIELVGNHIHDIRREPACPSAPSVGNGYAVWLNAYSDTRSKRITIKDNVFERITHDAIQTGSTDDLLIDGNEITAVKAVGCGDHSDSIQIVEGRRITVRANHVHDNVHGFMVNGHGTTVRAGLRLENNLVHHITGGIALNLYNVDRLALLNNTVWDTATPAVRLRDTTDNPTVMRATVRNNIFEEYGSECDSAGCVVAQERNLIGSGERGPSDLADSSPGLDARYDLAMGSPAIDAGTTTDAPTVDRLERPRDNRPDVGAHELQGNPGRAVADGDGLIALLEDRVARILAIADE